MSDEIATVPRLETQPSTPVSGKPTLSSRTSTEKSKYKRKFDRNLLATPSSKSPVSSATTNSSSPSLPTSAEGEPSTPTKLPQQYSLEDHIPSNDYGPLQPSSAPAIASAQYPPVMPLAPRSQLLSSSLPSPLPQPQSSGSMYYPQSYQPGNITYHASGPYQITPSPPSAANTPYGGEAYHRVPVGINPSPPVAMMPGCGNQSFAPSEPAIAELPAPSAPVNPQIQRPDDKNKQDTKDKAKPSFKRFFNNGIVKGIRQRA